ncbi:MAG: ABC transporter ATP-binding protein [Steroidobacteraceae bacterium]
MDYAIETRDLSKTYNGRIHALKGINLRVRTASCFGLLGPNGAGKSTLVKTLLSIVHASNGAAQLLGRDHRDPAARKTVGYLPEGHRFPLYLTGRGVCQYFGQLAGLSGAELARDIDAKLALVTMSEWADTRVGKYSKGMLQRLGLAQAMLGNPAILFLDEPTDGVDPVGRFELRNLIRSIQASGTTIFLNSHLLSEVEEICDEIAILHRGSIMQQGSVASITASVGGHGKNCLVTFTTSPIAAELLLRLAPTATVHNDQRGFQVSLDSESGISALIDLLRQNRVDIFGIEQARIDLEDAFIELIKSPPDATARTNP